MIQKIILASLITASFAFSSFAVAEAATAAGNHPRSVIMMEKLDTDKNGEICKEEHVSHGIDETKRATFAKQFDKFDANENESLTYAELNARFSSVKKK